MNADYMIEDLKNKGIKDKKVLEALKRVPRENFVQKEFRHMAYDDKALPIVSSQTISQPYTVAFMLENLELKEKENVLEIGSGSGWNSALIAFITKAEVFSVEFDEKVAEFARKNLEKAKVENVRIIVGDGNKGYEKEKPYDKIIVTAACSKLPSDLISQLKNKGIMLVPVGTLFEQNLIKITKKGKEIIKENLGKFVFVPLKGKYGF